MQHLNVHKPYSHILTKQGPHSKPLFPSKMMVFSAIVTRMNPEPPLSEPTAVLIQPLQNR